MFFQLYKSKIHISKKELSNDHSSSSLMLDYSEIVVWSLKLTNKTGMMYIVGGVWPPNMQLHCKNKLIKTAVVDNYYESNKRNMSNNSLGELIVSDNVYCRQHGTGPKEKRKSMLLAWQHNWPVWFKRISNKLGIKRNVWKVVIILDSGNKVCFAAKVDILLMKDNLFVLFKALQSTQKTTKTN